MTEKELLILRCKLEILITKREGMIAENEATKHLERCPVYFKDSFQILSGEIRDLIKEIKEEK